MQISFTFLTLVISFASVYADLIDKWNSCEMEEADFQLAPWVVTIRRVSQSGQAIHFPGAVLDHRTIITQFARFVVAPGEDWRLCEGATYTVFTGEVQNSSVGLGVIRVTPHPLLHLEGAHQRDHLLWMTQRYNLVLVHLRQPLVLSKALRPVCIPTPQQANDLKGLLQATGSGLISGYNSRLPDPDRLLTLGVDFMPEEQCLDMWKVITEEEPFGDRTCGHNWSFGTLINPQMICIPTDAGVVLRLGNRTLLLGFINEFYSNREKGRCDEVAMQYISIFNVNSTEWIRRGQKCGSGEFACSDGACILIRNLCDGVGDCSDGGDEEERYCQPRNCCNPDTEFACGVYGQCIPKLAGVGNCNGVVDCPGGEDEDPALCPKPLTQDPVRQAGVVIGALVAAAVAFSTLGVLVVYLRRRSRRKFLKGMISEFLEAGGEHHGKEGDGPLDIRRVRHDPSLEYPEEMCVLQTYITGGRFGAVYKAELNGETVVVKTNLGSNAGDVGSFISLLLELKMMLLLKKLGGHDNIVRFKGANTKHIREYRLQIAMEYCANGSLQDFLRSNRPHLYGMCARSFNVLTNFVCSGSEGVSRITTVDLVKWSMQIAQAMQFLACNRIVHGDLATRNVVLDGGLNAKLCDFGLSHQIFEAAVIYTTTTRLDIPWPWAAPEVLESLGRVYNLKSDVWSFGVTAWEIFSSGQVPWSEVGGDKELLMLLQGGAVLPKPEYCASDELHEILQSCWKLKAESRPSFEELTLQLQNIYDRMCCTFTARSEPEGPLASVKAEPVLQPQPPIRDDGVQVLGKTLTDHYITFESMVNAH